MSAAETWTEFYHTTEPDGQIVTEYASNDDDGDGYADREVTTGRYGPQPKERALRPPMDRSHRGCAGTVVRVYLDGKELT